MAQLQRIAIALDQLQQNQIWLTAQQQHYLSRVLRLQKGDRFIAMDGIGKWWLAQLEGEKAQILETLTVETELPISITLMVALPKNGFDEVVRCCTELGVACIAPVMSDRTLLNPSPQKLERWQRIASEAAEQSERSFVPTILEPVSFQAGLSSFATQQKYICEGRGKYPHLKKCLQQTGQTTILIATGPEGGWTEKEIDNAIQAGFQPVSLGRRILRAVTAPIVALSLISAACEVY
jgi:16S rRNA (uracil1498-N3)-methyltransferase